MAKMCPLNGCSHTQGFCVHEKMMMVMAVVAMLAAVAHFGFGLF